MPFRYEYVFTNRYGFARSVLAFGTLINLLFTPWEDYFTEISFRITTSGSSFLPNFFFLLGYEQVGLCVIGAIIILIWVISGYYPQISCLFHAWISYSFFSGSIIVEGGDQIAQIISTFLIPVCIFDKRINHWSQREYFVYKRSQILEYICFSFIVVVRFQMAIIYFIAAASKISVKEWISGSAVYYWFNHSPFGATGIVKTILNPIISNNYIIPAVTWGAVILEVILSTALLIDNYNFKRKLFWFGISFHFAIYLVHGLATFFIFMSAGLMLYLLPLEIPLDFNSIFKKSFSKESFRGITRSKAVM